MDWSWDGYQNHAPIEEVRKAAEADAATHEEGTEAWAEPLIWAALWEARDLGENEHRELEAVSKLEALQERKPSPVPVANSQTRRHYWARLGHNYKRSGMYDDA